MSAQRGGLADGLFLTSGVPGALEDDRRMLARSISCGAARASAATFT